MAVVGGAPAGLRWSSAGSRVHIGMPDAPSPPPGMDGRAQLLEPEPEPEHGTAAYDLRKINGLKPGTSERSVV